MESTFKQVFGGIVKTLLITGTSYLVGKGYFTDDAANQFVTAFTVIVVSVAWTVLRRLAQQKRIQAALRLPAGTSPKMLNREMNERQGILNWF